MLREILDFLRDCWYIPGARTSAARVDKDPQRVGGHETERLH